MTRDQLESVIWRESGRKLTTAQVTTILAAADSYALHVGGITAERRAAIAPLKPQTIARRQRADRRKAS